MEDRHLHHFLLAVRHIQALHLAVELLPFKLLVALLLDQFRVAALDEQLSGFDLLASLLRDLQLLRLLLIHSYYIGGGCVNNKGSSGHKFDKRVTGDSRTVVAAACTVGIVAGSSAGTVAAGTGHSSDTACRP